MDRRHKNGIKELTAIKQEWLTQYYEERWNREVGDAFRENLEMRFAEEYVPEAIQGLIEDGNTDERYIQYLQIINAHYSITWLQYSWDQIEELYGAFFSAIKAFFDPVIKRYYKEFEDGHRCYVEYSVKLALEEAI